MGKNCPEAPGNRDDEREDDWNDEGGTALVKQRGERGGESQNSQNRNNYNGGSRKAGALKGMGRKGR